MIQPTALQGCLCLTLAAAIGASTAASAQVPNSAPPAEEAPPPAEDEDLDRIPTVGAEEPVGDAVTDLPEAKPGGPASADPEAPARTPGTFFVQNSTVLTRRGISRFSLLSSPQVRLRNILFVDGRLERPIMSGLTLHASGRANFTVGRLDGSDIARPFRLDVREAYASWKADGFSFIDAGRINQKSGVAYGYNPTDYFRSGATVDPLTADAGALRESRLGSVMLRGQRFWNGGQALLLWSPKLSDPRGFLGQRRRHALDPAFARLNADNRLLLKIEQRMGANFRPEFLLYHDKRVTAAGANVTLSIGDQLVAHVEWSGARRPDVMREALRFGVDTGDLPAQIFATSSGGASRIRHDAVVGATIATASRLTLTAEYHFDGAALTRARWKRLFEAAEAPGGGLDLLALRYVQLYASVEGRTTSRHGLFVRAVRSEAFSRGLELTGLAAISPADGSAYVQGAASYTLSDRDSINATTSATLGGDRTSYGNLGRSIRAVVSFRRYF